MSEQILESEIHELDISHIVIEDDMPVDNIQSEKQQRLLVEPLYSSWFPGEPFIAASNVGVFYALKQSAIVPDAFLSLGVEVPEDLSKKKNRSYFVWEFGKVPEVCIEIVSNREGNELGSKFQDYARIGVAYYAVFDPLRQLQNPDELNGSLLKIWMLSGRHYVELYVELSPPFWLEEVGLGLTLWEGEFEGVEDLWLRWCDRSGNVIPTGKERANQAQQQAEQAQQKAGRLAERLRELGIDPAEI